MNPELAAALEEALGAAIARSRSIAGGDVSHAIAVDLADGREVFVKTHPSAPRDMYEAEARGLSFLRAANALRVPDVLAFSRPGDAGPAFLALEMLRPGPKRADYDERLGHGLAALHRASPGMFGLDHDNYVGPLPQENRPRATWAAFYGEARLLPMAERARSVALPAALHSRIERLVSRLPSLVGPEEPPARLHGDLWAGNVHVTPEGDPCLIDPAAYGGHREIDLAMLSLFGAPSSRFFAAYDESHPRAPGHEERVPLYQLYPLLVHVALFGAGYVSGVRRALDAVA